MIKGLIKEDANRMFLVIQAPSTGPVYVAGDFNKANQNKGILLQANEMLAVYDKAAASCWWVNDGEGNDAEANVTFATKTVSEAIITLEPEDKTIVSGGSALLSFNFTGDFSAFYWQSSTDWLDQLGNATWEKITGSDSKKSITVSPTATTYYRAVVERGVKKTTSIPATVDISENIG